MEDDAVVLAWLVGSIDLEGILASRPDLDREGLEVMKAQLLEPQLVPTSGEALVLAADAAVVGSPGPAGIGIVLETARGDLRALLAESIEDSSVNVAEARAVLRGVIEARRFCPSHLSIRSDSELLVRQLGGSIEVRHRELRAIHEVLGSELEGLASWEVRAVGREENARAHALARIGLERG